MEKVLNLQSSPDHHLLQRSSISWDASRFIPLDVFIGILSFYSRVEWHVKEGDVFEPVKHIATVRGKARFLLLGERIALNLLARCSGIATK